MSEQAPIVQGAAANQPDLDNDFLLDQLQTIIEGLELVLNPGQTNMAEVNRMGYMPHNPPTRKTTMADMRKHLPHLLDAAREAYFHLEEATLAPNRLRSIEADGRGEG